MKPEQLESLLMDRALGELEPEVAALLDEYLREHPEAQREAEQWLRFVAVAGEAVRAVPLVTARVGRIPLAAGARSLAVAAAVAALALVVVGAIWGGRVRPAGPNVEGRERAAVAWAAYEIAYDPARGGFMVTERGGRP